MPSDAIASGVLKLKHTPPAVADRLVTTLLAGDPAFERRNDRWRVAQGAAVGSIRSLHDIPFVVVDVETTGGFPPASRITEIAAVRVRAGRIEDEWSTLVNPKRSIPWFVSRLTGIDDAMVAEAPTFEVVADDFLDFLGSAPFVAHNALFDWRFVNAELILTRGSTLTNARLCTIRLARKLLPEVRRRSLDALTHLFGVTVEGRHRALGDARATARVLSRLLEVAEEQGISSETDLASLAGVRGTLYPGQP